MQLFEKTKFGSARKHAASRPNLLETPAGHEMFVKRRYNFAPARRRPVDQLDGGRQLDPEGSREKKEFKIGPIEPVPPQTTHQQLILVTLEPTQAKGDVKKFIVWSCQVK